MTGDELAGRLAEHGLDPREVAAKQLLFDRVIEAFRSFSSGPPAHAWWIPGRIEVFGKHTDYAGGHSLIGTVPRGFALVAARRADCVVRMQDARRGESFTVDDPADAAATGQTGWRRYAHVVVRRLARNFPDARLGADIVFASDLPPASGMSSSSALMVGLAAAVIRLGGMEERAEWRENVRSPADAAGYYACIENGMSFGTLTGDAGVGTHGGSEDHVAILCARPQQLSAWTFVPIQHVGDARLPDAWTFVIVSSGAAAKKTGAAQESYNRLSNHAAALLDLWNRAEPRRTSLHAAMKSDPSAPERLRRLIADSQLPDAMIGDLEHRLTHFLQEDARVVAAMQAFRDADRARLSALSGASQADAETLLRNHVPETLALAGAARDLGAFAASSFGAGFGGSVWALIDRDAAAAFAERWLDDYRSRFPERATATTFLARPGPPLTQVT